MRIVMLVIGLPVAFGLSVVSMIANWRFGIRLGAEDGDAVAYGLASVCADGLKIVLPFAMAWAWRRRRVAEWLSAAGLWLVISIYSLVSALSFAAVNRAEISARRSGDTLSAEGLRADLAAKRHERRMIGASRSVGTVAADLKMVEQQPRFLQTNRCDAPEGREARSLCERYHALSGELATAQQAERIDGAIADLTAKLDRTHLRAAGTATIDPQVDLFRELSGLAEGKIKLALAILVCVLIEAGSGLGLFVVLSCHRALGEEALASRKAPTTQPLLAAEPSDEAWLQERLEHADRGVIGAAELYADYRLWLEQRGRSYVLTVTAFGRWMTEIGIARDKAGGRIVYRGALLRSDRTRIALPHPA